MPRLRGFSGRCRIKLLNRESLNLTRIVLRNAVVEQTIQTLRQSGRGAAEGAGKRRNVGGENDLFGRFVAHLLTRCRWGGPWRWIDQPAVLHDFLDLHTVERLVFK